jgi:hypothetical protein
VTSGPRLHLGVFSEREHFIDGTETGCPLAAMSRRSPVTGRVEQKAVSATLIAKLIRNLFPRLKLRVNAERDSMRPDIGQNLVVSLLRKTARKLSWR